MTDGRTSDFKQLNVWQASMGLVKDIYSVARDLPVNERYGLIDQIKRSAVSIPSNIAEGQARGSAAEHWKRNSYSPKNLNYLTANALKTYNISLEEST